MYGNSGRPGGAASLPDYYKILELTPQASELDVKKAYRKLALAHHPDRNLESSEASKEKFQLIGEAYECLSDKARRGAYDQQRQFSSSSSSNPYHNPFATTQERQKQSYYRAAPRRPRVDPYAQFHRVFQNDAFFSHAAYDDMDDEFARRFGYFGGVRSRYVQQGQQDTSKSYVDGYGRRVLVQSMRRNGNEIEETYIENQLVERRINGQLVTLGPGYRAMGASSSSDTFSERFSQQRQDFSNKQSTSKGKAARQSATQQKAARAQKEADAAPMTSKTFMNEQGQKVLIQSLMKNGMQLEDRYVGDKLVESRVNGKVVAVY